MTWRILGNMKSKPNIQKIKFDIFHSFFLLLYNVRIIFYIIYPLCMGYAEKEEIHVHSCSFMVTFAH